MIIAGVDEAGRGPLAGPVYAAAVILPETYDLPLLTDSKALTALKRERLLRPIEQQAVSVGLGIGSVTEIDELNILQATLLAMRRAVMQLNPQPDLVLVDGISDPQLGIPTQTVIHGDLTVPAISAASIIAKVRRDHYMIELDALYPAYGFAKHKGYGTAQHLKALLSNGACAAHRTLFVNTFLNHHAERLKIREADQ
jgi:ribonuclease HII